ncbi:MAG: hypothetical protein FWC58_10495 [Desulfobulbus sp.]|nr:hypothetical protein [Desulfobulbus sp.]
MNAFTIFQWEHPAPTSSTDYFVSPDFPIGEAVSDCAAARGMARSARYNVWFRHPFAGNLMEAERLNSIANKLDDLAQRAAELRRYL